jgi:hypothetical protein
VDVLGDAAKREETLAGCGSGLKDSEPGGGGASEEEVSFEV